MATSWVHLNRKPDERNPLLYAAATSGWLYEVDNKWLNDPVYAGYKPIPADTPDAGQVRKIKHDAPPSTASNKTPNDTAPSGTDNGDKQ